MHSIMRKLLVGSVVAVLVGVILGADVPTSEPTGATTGPATTRAAGTGRTPWPSTALITATPEELAQVKAIDPPEKDFFAKRLDYEGIPIKAAAVVSDVALVEAKRRISSELQNCPKARAAMAKAGCELHIIGKDQVPSDLPELRRYKDKPWDGGPQNVDQRTRGVGGRLTSCGEENLLHLPKDRYQGRDICIHEFAHCIRSYGQSPEVRRMFDDQLKASLDKGRWVNAYAATNTQEYFAELTMWYFGTHGDMHMRGEKPAFGREGLKKYDPEAYDLIDRFYSGKLDDVGVIGARSTTRPQATEDDDDA